MNHAIEAEAGARFTYFRLLAARSGNILNKSDVARDVGISVKAAGDWISVLQASGQIVLLEPWFTNISKRVVRTPKIYFCDTGLLCYLFNITSESLPSSALLGSVWETFVFAELRKSVALLDKPASIWFYRDQRSLARRTSLRCGHTGQRVRSIRYSERDSHNGT